MHPSGTILWKVAPCVSISMQNYDQYDCYDQYEKDYVRIMPSPQTQLAFVAGPPLSLTPLTDRMEQAIPENRLTSGKL